jgi:hypothetical protein
VILRLVPFLACFAAGLGDALFTAFGANLVDRLPASAGSMGAGPSRRVTIDAFLAGSGGSGALLTLQGRVGLPATLALAAATGLLVTVVVRSTVQLLEESRTER